MNVRPLGAACAAAAAAALLHLGGAAWPVALLGGAGGGAVILWRTVAGVWVAFSLLLAAALAAWALQSAPSISAPRSLLPWLGGLEAYGIATILAVRAVREPVQVSRRLLGAWLASTGAIALGLALSCDGRASAIGSVLVTFGIMHKLGVVPAYAWAPMLIRHPSPRIRMSGVAGLFLAGMALAIVVPRLGDRANAGWTIIALSAITAPWALWQVARQWRSDRRCAGTYAVVASTAVVLLWLLTPVVS